MSLDNLNNQDTIWVVKTEEGFSAFLILGQTSDVIVVEDTDGNDVFGDGRSAHLAAHREFDQRKLDDEACRGYYNRRGRRQFCGSTKTAPIELEVSEPNQTNGHWVVNVVEVLTDFPLVWAIFVGSTADEAKQSSQAWLNSL